MATRAHSTPASASRRRLPPASPLARRRGPALPPELAHLAPILAQRSRIEALAAALIDLLDSFDAPMEDGEPDADSEDTYDAELSEPGEELLSRHQAVGPHRGIAA